MGKTSGSFYRTCEVGPGGDVGVGLVEEEGNVIGDMGVVGKFDL